MREWSSREDFRGRLPQLLRGESQGFAAYIQGLADDEAKSQRG